MPTFNDVLAGSLAQAVQVQQIIDALKGTAGKGIAIALVSLNDPSNYALSVQNDDSTNSRALSVLKADGTNLITADITGVTLGTPLHIPATSIGTTELADGSVTNAKLAADAVTTNKVLDGTLVGTDMQARSITAGQIALGTLTTNEIADGTILTSDLSGGAITQNSFSTISSANSTTSGTAVAMDSAGFTPAVASSFVLVDYRAVFQTTVAGAFGQLYIRVDAGGWTALSIFTMGATSSYYPVSINFAFTTLTAAAHTIDIGWSTSSGTLSVYTGVQRTFRISEFKR